MDSCEKISNSITAAKELIENETRSLAAIESPMYSVTVCFHDVTRTITAICLGNNPTKGKCR